MKSAIPDGLPVFNASALRCSIKTSLYYNANGTLVEDVVLSGPRGYLATRYGPGSAGKARQRPVRRAGGTH